MRTTVLLSALTVLTSCHAGRPGPLAIPAAASTAPLAPPPLPPAAAVVDAGVGVAPPILAPPVLAKLVTLTKAGVKIPFASPCDVVFIAMAKGAGTVSGQSLAAGDVLMTSSPKDLELVGSGLAAVITSVHDCAGQAPDARSPGPRSGGAKDVPSPLPHIAHAGDAKELVWAGGAMHAHLDLEPEVSPEVYVGRLEGTAPVAEHDHAASWEVLCALEGSGTFTLDGISTHIVGPAIVAVPPGRKHSWLPDPGSKLVAVQVYVPPGPEQRFKVFAAVH